MSSDLDSTGIDSMWSARSLVAASSKTDDPQLRALYTASARNRVNALRAELEALESVVRSQEAELIRLAAGGA